jgi:hypothetical protein
MRKIRFLAWMMLLVTGAPSIAATGNELPGYMPIVDAQSPYTATTAGQFARDCQHDEASCASIIGNVLMARIQFSPTSHLCLSDVDYANAVTPWLRAHPEAAALSVEDGVFLALNKLYKCGAPNNY